MHTLTKRRFKNKKGCGCQMCKPFKHGHDDRRRPAERKADESYLEQVRFPAQHG